MILPIGALPLRRFVLPLGVIGLYYYLPWISEGSVARKPGFEIFPVDVVGNSIMKIIFRGTL